MGIVTILDLVQLGDCSNIGVNVGSGLKKWQFCSDRSGLNHPAFITTLGLFLPNAQMESRPSDKSIIQVLQEIGTHERIANCLNDLNCLCDRLLRRGSVTQ